MPFANDEGGLTTPAAAVALLVVCALLFTCLHGYTVGSRSGQIQYVADAGALAADNVVAEFVTAGQVVDAVLLSCSLLAVTIYAASAVAAFIPGGSGVAARMVEMGAKVMNFRDKFADSASKGLDRAQKALPALAAVRAASCMETNARASGIEYQGLAVTFPAEGGKTTLPDDDEVEKALADVEEREEAIQEGVVRQQEASEAAEQAKEQGWIADCGAPGMDMQERAQKLAGLTGAQNPLYESVDIWSFSVALERAKNYYAARYRAEPGSSFKGTPELIAESVARKRFYKYALEEVSKGSIETTASGFELPSLKSLARNNRQIKDTPLYTERIYPVSGNAGSRYIHAYGECPYYLKGSAAGTAAVCDEDAGSVLRCPVCKFSALTLGRVPSASTSIDNGFEYHYRKLVEAADAYRQAVLELEELNGELRKHKEGVQDDISAAMDSIATMRYDPQPPGRYGCVCIVYAPAVSTGFLPFVSTSGELADRVAISGATLAADPADDEGNVIADIADGLMPEDVAGSSILHMVLGAWGSLLNLYAGGVGSLQETFDKTVQGLPLTGTDLSVQASDAFGATLSAAGFEPPDLAVYKPVLVNSSHVLERDGGSVASAVLAAKQGADAYGAAYVGDLQVLYSQVEALPDLEGSLVDGELVLADLPFSIFGLGLSDATVSIPAPQDLVSRFEELFASSACAGEGG